MPVKLISETVANTLRLSCNKAELEKLDPLRNERLVVVHDPQRMILGDSRFEIDIAEQ